MNRTHGHRGDGVEGRSPTYESWRSMRERVSSVPAYEGREIHPSWDRFEQFLADMGERPEGLTLERIDNELGYFKENCKWTTPTEQQRNRRPVQVNNQTGLKGVAIRKGRYYEAYYPDGRRSVSLGGTTDFFEACCRRKSWEAKQREAT